jgi:hypothetical protein
MTSNIYAIATLTIAIAAVAFKTWRSAQATSSVGQLIYETNSAKTPRGRARS